MIVVYKWDIEMCWIKHLQRCLPVVVLCYHLFLQTVCSMQLPTERRMRLFWDPHEHKEGGPFFDSRFDPSIERTQPWPSICIPWLLPASIVGQPNLGASRAVCPAHGTRSIRSLLMRQQIGFEYTWWLSPTSLCWSSSLFFNQPKTIPVSPCFLIQIANV